MTLSMFRRMVFAAMLTITPATTLIVADAQATSLVDLTTDQMTDASTYIVRGTISDVWSEQDQHGTVWTRAKIQVGHVYKGTAVPDELIIDSMGGTHGDTHMQIWGRARFSKGEDAFFFIDTLDNGRLTPLTMFHGKYTVRRAPGEKRSYARRWQGNPDVAFDHRFLPHPKPQNRVYLDTLVEQVQSRLSVGWDGKAIPGISNTRLRAINTPAWRLR